MDKQAKIKQLCEMYDEEIQEGKDKIQEKDQVITKLKG